MVTLLLGIVGASLPHVHLFTYLYLAYLALAPHTPCSLTITAVAQVAHRGCYDSYCP